MLCFLGKVEGVSRGIAVCAPRVFNEKKERKIPMHQMMRDEALKAFELWDKKTDKVKY